LTTLRKLDSPFRPCSPRSVSPAFIKGAAKEAVRAGHVELVAVLGFAFDAQATELTEADGVTVTPSDEGSRWSPGSARWAASRCESSILGRSPGGSSLYAGCMQTSMRVDKSNRDALARIAARELGGVSLDEALRIVLFEHECLASYARLVDDPDSLADYRAEAAQLGEVDVAVAE